MFRLSTGKSHLYKEISPNSILVSGGQTTVANLFYNMGGSFEQDIHTLVNVAHKDHGGGGSLFFLATGLAEFLRELRKEQHGDALDKFFRLGKNLNQRDTIAVVSLSI